MKYPISSLVDVDDVVIATVAYVFDVDKSQISRDDTFVKLGADSLSFHEMITGLEEAFDIDIADEVAYSAVTENSTVGDLIQAVKKHQNHESGA